MNLYGNLTAEFGNLYPEEAAAVLEGLPVDSAASLLVELDATIAGRTLECFAPQHGASVLESMSPEQAAEVAASMTPVLAANALRRFSEDRRESLFNAAIGERMEPVKTLLRFPEGTAGALMDTRVLALPDDTRVEAAADQYRAHPESTHYYLYVVNRKHQLVGVLDLPELLQAAPETELREIMQSNVDSLRANAGRQAIITHPGWRRIHSLPVVDETGVFVGVIQYSTYRRLELDLDRAKASQGSGITSQALADLFLTGLAGVAQVSATLAGRRPSPQGTPRR
jgi:Mg/Co/Ni transporter MgtE